MNFTVLKINWKGIIFWSNQFYGICAVLLMVESSLVILHKIPSLFLLLLIHLATILYYTHAYLKEQKDGIYSERTSWYKKNKTYLIYRQGFYTMGVIYLALVHCDFLNFLTRSSFLFIIFLFFTILLSVLYYLPSLFVKSGDVIRKWGILKSMSIAWVWTFTCGVLPIWHSNYLVGMTANLLFWLHIVTLFIFTLILAILFDIKDLNRDELEKTQTIVLKIGKDRIVNSVILPLLMVFTILKCVQFYYFTTSKVSFLIQALFIIWMYLVSRMELHKKSIYMNIVLIDGMVVIKVLLSLLGILLLERSF